MKKIALTIIFALFVVLSVSAQNKVGFGLKAGLNTAMEWAGEGSSDTRIGLNAGIFVEIPVANRLDIQPELLYSMQGGVTGDVTDKFDYVNLPIIFKIYVNEARSFSIDVGPQVGYMISGKISIGSRTIDMYNDLNKVDVAICLGATYKITQNFHANLRFNFGVLKLVDDVENRNGVGQLGLSYRF